MNTKSVCEPNILYREGTYGLKKQGILGDGCEGKLLRFGKRAFDFLFSLSVIVPTSILCFIPISIAVKVSSPGPILFRQKRTGLHGKDFYCLKFRTMCVNSECDTTQASRNDPRKTKVGNFLRKMNLDELPQFFNVLRGDMSIVGPRPHMLMHTQQYTQLIAEYPTRHLVKPGITGWAQVNGYRGETRELWQMQGRVEHDVWYIKNWSFWLDIKIVALTCFNCFKQDSNAF